MSAASPLEDYREVCDRFFRVQAIEDWQERAEGMRDLQSRWADCFARLMEIAEASGAEVWLAIGDALSNGRGTERNREEAARWFQRAADAGHSRAMVQLGYLLRHPDTPESHACAIEWYRQAAELGDPSGMVALGFACREGRGVSVDPGEAARWFVRAVEAGDSHAMILAGRMFAGCVGSPVEAEKWFLRAADAGHTESHIALADIYSDRKSPMHDAASAHRWYRVTAEQSSPGAQKAMLALARQCRDGDGTEQSREKAKEWLLRLLQIAQEKSALRNETARLLRQIEDELI